MAKADEALQNWESLNNALRDSSLTEKQGWDLLEKERKGQRRLAFMLRIYGRANKMRTERERKEIAGSVSQK